MKVTKPEEAGKKFYVDIEGTEYPWETEAITVPQIRELGGIPADVAVVQEDEDGNERTLSNDETVELKPGHRHGRAPKYKRG